MAQRIWAQDFGELPPEELAGLVKLRDEQLARTGAPGIHFQDHPQLLGYWLPEWSHLAANEADRFTAALYPLVHRASAVRGKGD